VREGYADVAVLSVMSNLLTAMKQEIEIAGLNCVAKNIHCRSVRIQWIRCHCTEELLSTSHVTILAIGSQLLINGAGSTGRCNTF
jgi:hypothetical protein